MASLLSEVCRDLAIEPELQSLTGESFHYQSTLTNDEVPPDVSAQGFWGNRNTEDFFDVKFLTAMLSPTRKHPLSTTFSQLEQLK